MAPPPHKMPPRKNNRLFRIIFIGFVLAIVGGLGWYIGRGKYINTYGLSADPRTEARVMRIPCAPMPPNHRTNYGDGGAVQALLIATHSMLPPDTLFTRLHRLGACEEKGDIKWKKLPRAFTGYHYYFQRNFNHNTFITMLRMRKPVVAKVGPSGGERRWVVINGYEDGQYLYCDMDHKDEKLPREYRIYDYRAIYAGAAAQDM